MSKDKQVIKWWSSWNLEKIEKWLEQMESEGWQLTNISWKSLRFHFERGEPRKIRYGVDYQNKQDPNYVQLFEEAGWESVYSDSGWYIWRMPYTATRPEIYSDLDSLIAHNKNEKRDSYK
jgi:hypothetical protein